jgi:hypothetical protein
MRTWLSACFLFCTMLAGNVVHAQARAWFDRDRIGADETATLNIETTQLAGAPEYAPLMRDFSLSGHTSSRRVESVNGTTRTRTLYAVALQPRREGVIGIPSLRVGNETTPPLTLTVTPASTTPTRAGGVVFIESDVDDRSPYVQQAVGFTVRLYYAVPLISGQLDQPAPDGASLQRVGEDLKYVREIGGRRYEVVERHYLLVPERSGPLAIPGARFHGQGVGGFFDEMFGDGRRALDATAAPERLQVQAAPANAPQPWLPLRELRLRYAATPQRATAGAATTVVLEAIADGASAAQLPDLELDAGNDAQVFPEPAQVDETLVDGRPRTRVTRRFSVVPARAGPLRIEGPRLPWWDVQAGAARTATLPALTLEVAPGSGGFSAPAVPAATASGRDVPADDGRIVIPGIQGRVLPWAAATAAFALLWFATLWWGLHRRPAPVVESPRGDGAESGQHRHASLKRALDTGDFGEIVDALGAMADPPTRHVDELRQRLADPAQRDALAALERARWADGDGPAARQALRAAFRSGPCWRSAEPAAREPLPPLYPPARHRS